MIQALQQENVTLEIIFYFLIFTCSTLKSILNPETGACLLAVWDSGTRCRTLQNDCGQGWWLVPKGDVTGKSIDTPAEV